MDGLENIKNTLRPGDVLVSLGDILPDLEHLQRHFDIIDFLDVCAMIETVVIHEKLICVGPNADRGARDLLAPLINNDILLPYRFESPSPMVGMQSIMGHERAKEVLDFLPTYISAEDNDLFPLIAGWAIGILMDFVLEQKLEIPLALSAHGLPLYTALNFNKEDQKFIRGLRGSLATSYGDMKTHVMSKIKSLEQEPVLVLPPLALEVLGATERLDALMKILLDKRLEYEKLRSRITEIDTTLRSRDKSYASRLREESKLVRSLRELIPRDKSEEMTYFTEIDSKFVEAVKTEARIDGFSMSAADLPKILSVLLKLAENIFWKSRLGPLHATRRRYLEYAGTEVNRVTQRLFGHELTPKDLQRAQRYEITIQRWKEGGRVV
jgi:hypothetical protein